MLSQFADDIEERAQRWREYAERGDVGQRTLNHALDERRATTKRFQKLLRAALADGWSEAELRLLVHVYEEAADSYREAWEDMYAALREQFTQDELAPLRRNHVATNQGSEKTAELLREAGQA